MSVIDVPSTQKQLIASLVATLEKPGHRVRLFETHISWVLVSGEYAYKLKKAVRFDFLDFSTLDARRFYCEEELRLNRRLAPQLYLEVVGITGTVRHPVIGGIGVPIEYAVRLRAFEQEALWSYRIASELVTPEEADALAIKIARFHQAARVAPSQASWGSVATLQGIAAANLRAICGLARNAEQGRNLHDLTDWITAQHRKLHGTFHQRKLRGFIRECHGDLHVRNILTQSGRVEVFDCIEFNESLRWIDVMNEIAFICMDLQFHARTDLAARILNQYLEVTGDYEGIPVLRYYEVQRALTRCKVALLQAGQAGADARDSRACKREGLKYLACAAKSIKRRRLAIMITHGYSGSGKSSFSRCLVGLTGAICLRSDVERKRIAGIDRNSRAGTAPGSDLYGAHSTRLTYERLHTLSRHLIESGWPVIVDAAFLKIEQRRLFEHLAADLRVPFFIFDIHATEPTIRTRLMMREKDDRDPSDSGIGVLARQLADSEPLSDEETKHVVAVDLESGLSNTRIRKICDPVLKLLYN
jgi:aminoglycoside phosphotransferase family enzyme/predicted kinase